MQPRTIFEAHFRAADVLLRVYRLLESEDGTAAQPLRAKIMELLECGSDEETVLLLNDLFVGLVRERAGLPANFFKRSNLNLLLRQAVVSACTAMDVYFPTLLETHLPTVVQIRQRNFLPSDNTVKDMFRGFRITLDQLPALLEEPVAADRWSILTRKLLDYCRSITFSNPDGIYAVILILGTVDPWRQIAERTGRSAKDLREQIQNITKRRNDIVHRGDRPVGQPDADPQPIDYAWTSAHVMAVQSVVLACEALAQESIQRLKTEAGGVQ